MASETLLSKPQVAPGAGRGHTPQPGDDQDRALPIPGSRDPQPLASARSNHLTPGLVESRMRRKSHVRFGQAAWGDGSAETPTPRPRPTPLGRGRPGRAVEPGVAVSLAPPSSPPR